MDQGATEQAAAMPEAARFELVEGATFQLPDGSSVTVRDGQLELSDGRRLPMPAAGEAITVERTITRPDGGTTRIKHTIRLNESEPIQETPARPFAGAGPGSDEEDAAKAKKEEEVGETVSVPAAAAVTEAAPTAEPAKTGDEKDSSTAAPEHPPAAASETDAQLPDAPSKEPAAAEGAAPVKPVENTLMGVNCGRRSLRDMLWGSIPESGFGEDEDEPKAPPKGLLNKSYSIKEEDESEHEDGDETHEEPLESSENADESFEFVDDKGKDAGKGKESDGQKEADAAPEPEESKEEDKPELTEKESENEKAPEKDEAKGEKEPEKEPKPEEASTEPVQSDSTTKITLVTFHTSTKSEDAPQKADSTGRQTPASSSKEKPENQQKPEEAEPEKPVTELLAEQTAAVMATTSSIDQPSESSPDQPAESQAESHHEKPVLTRQDKLPSSGNLVAQAKDDIVVRVGVPTLDAAPDSKPIDTVTARIDSNEESTASPSSDGAVPETEPRPDETTHELHLKLTPILRSLETEKPKSAESSDGGERAPKHAPSEDRKGTVPPNTPAVVEDREGLLGADEPEPEPEPVSVPKRVGYFESMSPKSSPAPTRSNEAETSAVPKVIKFAMPEKPEKVYLGGQEPEEMEDTPIPRAAEPPTGVKLAPEPAALPQQTRVLIPVRGAPDELDPLSALVTSEATDQPSAPEEKSDDPATPSTTPEKEAAPDATPNAAPAETEGNQKPAPPVYKPELFEPEPKRPLILTSEVDEDAPPYESGVHDARTLPIGRKTAVVTEQPPPFGDEDRSDPRDPFLPDQPRVGAKIKDDGWFTTCFDLCCCCWAP